MLITSSCPLRISLVGGSTDHPEFLKKYGRGSVISFPSDLRTYATIHKDVFGSNSLKSNYVLNYSRREEVDTADEIQNELIRNCFSALKVEEVNLFFTSDVYSSGSGLASSSAYLISLISAIRSMRNEDSSEVGICQTAMEIEKTFNPLVGQQDFYGSLGGLKRINFSETGTPLFKYFSTEIFEEMSMFLLHTGIMRSSTEVLKSIDINKSVPLLQDVEDLEKSILDKNTDLFNSVINRTWANKKSTSPMICENAKLQQLDNSLMQNPYVLSHKLLGAGNGGYFLIFSWKKYENLLYKEYPRIRKILISNSGVQTVKI
jgi:D-glycero-alpha-D-manno-heptose-7-phosphate kinase